jgi:aldehyde dehydrogenase (NAD+)
MSALDDQPAASPSTSRHRRPAPIQHPHEMFIAGRWTASSSPAQFVVTDSTTEAEYLRVVEAHPADVASAVGAARSAFDEGPWPQMRHAERAEYLRTIAVGLRARAADLADVWTRQSGVLHRLSQQSAEEAAKAFEFYAGLADTFAFEEAHPPAFGDFGLLVREPVGVVGAIIPWNSPLTLITYKVAPALLAGCTVVVKLAPEAPGEGYILAEVIEAAGLPGGVVNVLTADREASELLVRDPRVDKIAFTGSTAVGRRIASLCAERIARYTLELGGKSAAVILDDADLTQVAASLSAAQCRITGQVCSALTRIIVSRSRHDELVDALAAHMAEIRVGDPFNDASDMGPLVSEHHRDRVEAYIAKGVAEGARLSTGGGRPQDLASGWFVQPTVFGDVDNQATIAREEIFGPVLAVIKADDESDAIRAANDTIYGLNASVFTNDVDRARWAAGRLRSGTVGQNGSRADFGIAFGGFKQSGVGREGGIEGLLPYLETKTVILDGVPSSSPAGIRA